MKPAPHSVDAECMEKVLAAEEMFLARWRLSSLRAVDAQLHDRLQEQRTLFDHAVFGSDSAETRLQADATVRGWKAALTRMEGLEQPEDAFMYGTDPETGLVLAIGVRPPSESRLRLKDGHRVIFVTPDEMAKMVAGMTLIAEAKKAFPDAEVMDLRPWPKTAE